MREWIAFPGQGGVRSACMRAWSKDELGNLRRALEQIVRQGVRHGFVMGFCVKLKQNLRRCFPGRGRR